MQIFEKAEWIWHPACRGENEYVDFSAAFAVDEVGETKIRISVDGNYALWLNGTFVSCGQYADYEDMKFYDTLDVTAWVKPGRNELNITAFYPGRSFSTYRKGTPGLLFEVGSGTQVYCVSDTQTQVRKNPYYISGGDMETVSGQLGFSFHYDATSAEVEAFQPAVPVCKPKTVAPRPIEKLKIGEPAHTVPVSCGTFTDTHTGTPAERMQFAALAGQLRRELLLQQSELCYTLQAAGGDGVYALFDLEKETAGLPYLEIELPEACEVLFGWGEHLNDLHVRTLIGSRHFCASIRLPAGKTRFEHPFLRCGLRYVQLHIYAPTCKIYAATVRPTDYPLATQVPFACGDELHQRIYDTAIETLHLCMHEHYEDCPWREQALYSMDSRNQMLCGYYAFRETRFPRASIALMAHSLRKDGLLELCSPAKISITIPSFSAIFLTQLWEYFEHSGDAAFAREMLPTAKQIADGFLARIVSEKGLVGRYVGEPYWNFYEWQDGLSGPKASPDTEVYDAPLNAFISFALRDLAKLCASLGEHANAAKYQQAHLCLNSAMQLFFVPERGVYASFWTDGVLSHFAELTNALVAYADAVPADALPTVRAHLLDGSLLEATLSHSIFKYEVLLQDAATYAKPVFEQVAQKWGGMLQKGATSFWETEVGAEEFDGAASLCHGWSAIPIVLYHKYYASLADSDK